MWRKILRPLPIVQFLARESISNGVPDISEGRLGHGWVACVALGPVTPHWTRLVLVGNPSASNGLTNNKIQNLGALRGDILVPCPPFGSPA